jgi:hypothetical protein
MFRSLLKLPKHKRFEFPTRYYDAQKEEFEQRVKEIEAKIAMEKNGGVLPEIYKKGYADRISRSFRENRRSRSVISGLFSGALFTRILIMGVLLSIMYVYLEFGDKISEIMANESISSSMGWVLSAILLTVVYVLMRRH